MKTINAKQFTLPEYLWVRGLTQTEFSELVQKDNSDISRILTGEYTDKYVVLECQNAKAVGITWKTGYLFKEMGKGRCRS